VAFDWGKDGTLKTVQKPNAARKRIAVLDFFSMGMGCLELYYSY
jgi:hypothetical protein